jgi:hypothetical protein
MSSSSALPHLSAASRAKKIGVAYRRHPARCRFGGGAGAGAGSGTGW